MIPARISGTASLLPGRRVSTEEVVAAAFGTRDPAELKAKTGIVTRYWADPEVPLATLATQTLQAALQDAGVRPQDLSRIIVANCTGSEFAFPGVANRVADGLGLRGECDAFDVNNACMGFLTALDLGARSVATGMGPVGLVSIELCSRHIRPEDPRPYLVFGDGVAAAVITPSQDGSGVVASHLGNDGSLGGNAILKNPSLTGQPEYIEFPRTLGVMTSIAVDKVSAAAARALKTAGLQMSQIDWVLPHQPNGSMLDKIIVALGVDPARTINVVREIGSVGSSAMPISLDRLRRSARLKAGQHVLMVGVGAGVSYGAVLYRVGG